MKQKVIAHFLGEKSVVKGYTHNFFPAKPLFHLERHDAPAGTFPEMVPINKLKALFFVKTFEGDDTYRDHQILGHVTAPGRKIHIEFTDGEEMTAYCENYHPEGLGFIAFPADPNSNNERVFVVNTSVKAVKFTEQTPSG